MSALNRSLSRRLLWLATALATVVLTAIVAGCGGGGGNADADPAKIAPPGTVVYLMGTARPDGGQKDAVNSIAGKVFSAPDPGRRIQDLVDKQLKQDPQTRNTTYAKDIEPWLGKRIAVAITGFQAGQPQLALIVAAKDTAKASDLIENEANTSSPKWTKRNYNDVDYWFDASDKFAAGVVGDYVVLGTEPTVKQVIAASKDGKGLDQAAAYKEVASGATDKLGFGYVDVKGVIGQASQSGQLPPQLSGLQSLIGAGAKPVTMSLDATQTQVALEVVARGAQPQPGGDKPPTLVPALPGDSWLAFGARALGQSISKALTQLSASMGEATMSLVRQQLKAETGLDLDRDILAALGDVALFARGTGLANIGGGAVVQTPDPAAARRLVDKLQPFVARQASSGGAKVADTTVAGAKGFSVSGPGLPGAVNVVAKEDRLVIAYSDSATEAAFSSASPLSNSPDYKAAQESLDGAPPSLFVSFAPIAGLVGTSSDAQAQQAKTYLERLRTLAVGAKTEGDTQTSRFVLTVK
jgi:hypothetical protein